ncbi:MAG TPA: hypothetical protein VMS96_12170 [Terriglobales bacterium]|nr:hypothetical protein [Terriglobales bacterium]
MRDCFSALKDDPATLAFAVFIGGVLILRFAAPPVPVLLGCAAAVLSNAWLKAMHRKRSTEK